MKLKLALFSYLLVFSTSNALANAVPTNMDGVVVKNIECIGSFVKFNVSNRSNSPINGTIIATIFDQDSDPIDNGKKMIDIDPVSGTKVYIEIDCTVAAKYTFRIE